MKTPWLSLVTITKGEPSDLARTLGSSEGLRRLGAEQVVVDGRTAAVDWDDAQFPGTRRIRRSPQGIADAFNAGLAAATGEWIWFLNGGDRVDARLAPEFLRALLESTQASVIIGGTTYEGEAVPRPHPPAKLQWPPVRAWIPHPSTLVRRRLFDEFGGFDPKYAIAMDYEWWLRVLPCGVPVDVVAWPFAFFAGGGVSQRPEFQQTIRREQNDAIRRHHRRLWRFWLGGSARLLRAWLIAQTSPRLRGAPRAS